jgi:2'-5' RNA ligase
MINQYLRTFIGLPLYLSQGILDARLELMRALDGERISWVDPGRYHVTLRFIGDTKVSAVKEIGQALHSGLRIPGETTLDLTGLGSFGPRKRPRVIYIGFEESDFFITVKREVDQILEAVGIPVENSSFRAHLTLGRVRSLGNLNHYYKTVEEMDPKFLGRVRFEKLIYFQSVLGAGGTQYRVLDEICFRKGITPC